MSDKVSAILAGAALLATGCFLFRVYLDSQYVYTYAPRGGTPADMKPFTLSMLPNAWFVGGKA